MTRRPTYRFFALSFACFLVLAASPRAQGVFWAYENSSYGGTSWGYNLASYAGFQNLPLAFSGGPNDDITSLQWNLDPFISLTFYENSDGSGRQYHVAYNAPRVGGVANVGSTYNDSFSAWSFQYDDPAEHGTVTLYEDTGWGGIKKRLPLSSYPSGQIHQLAGFEDMASSMTWDIEPNHVVILYEHANGTGREYWLRHDSMRVGLLGSLGSAHNDRWSSWQWGIVDPAQGWFRAYADHAYSGDQIVRYATGWGGQPWALLAANMNDRIDSIEWSMPPGRSLLFYEKSPAGGACLQLDGSGAMQVHNREVYHDEFSTFEFTDGDYTAGLADRDRPYDRNCYIGANQAHAHQDANWNDYHQDWNLSEQLDYGARAFKVEASIHNGTIHMTNGTWAQSVAAMHSGFQPQTLADFLDELDQAMTRFPREVVTLVIESADSGAVAEYVLDTSAIKGEVFVQSRATWPTLNELVAMGKRYVVFEEAQSTPSGRLPALHDYWAQNKDDDYFQTARHSGSLDAKELDRGLFFLNHVNGNDPSHSLFGSPNDVAQLNHFANQFDQLPNVFNVDRIGEGGNGIGDATRIRNRNLWQFPWQDDRAAYARFGPRNCGNRELSATSRPIVGSTLDLELDKGAQSPASAFEFLIFGTTDVANGPLPLPVPMPPPFGASCILRVSLEIVLPLGFGGYPIATPIAMPNSAGLVGTEAFFQTAGLVLGTGQYVMSDAGRARIGSH